MKLKLLTAAVGFGLAIAAGHAQAVIDLPATGDTWRLAVNDGAATMSTVALTDTPSANLLFATNDPNSWISWFVDPASSGVSVDGDALKAVVGKVSEKAWQSAVVQRDIPLIEGQTYVLKYRAKASEARPIFTMLQVQAGDYHNVGLAQQTALTTDWQTFTYSFVAKGLTSDGEQFVFQIGQKAGTVWIADASLALGSGAATIPGPTSAIQVVITKASSPYWKIRLNSKDFNLVEGKKYTISYALKADTPRVAGAVPQVDGDDYHSVGAKGDFRAFAGPVWRRRSVTFVATNVKPNATMIVLPLGATTGTFWFGDAKITEAP